jgi:putative tricarboxylic transport membrane protein
MTANRISGLAVTLFALAMIYLVIPAHTEAVGSGWMKPDTLPVACCIALALLGAAHAVRARGKTSLNGPETARFLGAVLIVIACLWIMGTFGFLPGAIATLLALMLLSGERRPLLMGSVGILVPFGSWLIVEQLLQRSLP